MKRKIATTELKKGMYVSELDRPWLETPFLFQGFVVRSDEELKALHECCQFVFIDDEAVDSTRAATSYTRKVAADEAHATPPQHERPIEEELAAARQVRQTAEAQITTLLEGARLGKDVDVKAARRLVGDVVESMLRNPDALLLLSYIRRHEKEAEAHAINSSILALTLGRYLKLPHHELEELALAALLHDIGETAISLELLQNGAKNEAETRQLQQHTKLGAFLLRKIPGMPESVIDVALQHHEQVDGNGYPAHLKGDEISRNAKVVAIVSSYDRICNASDGPRLPPSEALRYIYLYRGTQFDAELTEAFIKCLGIYPVGSIVELANGGVGIVIAIPLEDHLHPRILLVRNSHKEPLQQPHVMSLALFARNDAQKYAIARVHPPGSFGIDINRYLSDTSLI